MNILYLINQYPKVSHTFIRREIQGLEKRGNKVYRVAMRHDDPSSMSVVDQSEYEKTHYVLKVSKLKLMKDMLLFICKSPRTFIHLTGLLFKMYRASKETLVKHLIYLIESINVATLAKEKNIEHIHAHFGTNPAEVAMYASRICKIPYSFTVHGPEEFDKPLTLNLNTKIKYAKYVIAITSYCRSQLFRWADYQDWQKIKIVHCALETSFFDANNKTARTEGDTKQFLCIGRICEQKGQLLLLEAFSEFVKSGKKARLVFAGDGEMRAELEALVSKNNLQAFVDITGWIDSDRIKSLLNESDSMVLPSFAEGLPVAIMEAMAAKVPVISTSIAGIPELVKHQETGFLLFPGSTESLLQAMNAFDEISEEKLTKIVNEAYTAVKESHSIDVEVEKLEQIFLGDTK